MTIPEIDPTVVELLPAVTFNRLTEEIPSTPLLADTSTEWEWGTDWAGYGNDLPSVP